MFIDPLDPDYAKNEVMYDLIYLKNYMNIKPKKGRLRHKLILFYGKLYILLKMKKS